MTIHDELILALLEPQRNGKIGRNAPIIGIVRDGKIEYQLEETVPFFRDVPSRHAGRTDLMTPDIIITFRTGKKKAIELENDIKWDFGSSLRQIKKYQKQFETIIIIPSEYNKYAPLYLNEDIQVFLWTATRIWQCQTCGTITEKMGKIPPKCSECNKKTDHNLEGIKDVKFEEYLI